MSGLAISVLLQVSVVAAAPQTSYEQAFQQSTETGQPLVVLIGADWCPSCQVVKREILPKLRRQGSFEGVAFATVDSDHERKLAAKLMSGTKIPQLIVYEKNDQGWVRRQLTGRYNLERVATFLNRAGTTNVASRTAPTPN